MIALTCILGILIGAYLTGIVIYLYRASRNGALSWDSFYSSLQWPYWMAIYLYMIFFWKNR